MCRSLGGSVRITLTVLALVSFFCLLCSSQNSRAVPPGMRHAQELQAQNESSYPPIGSARSSSDSDNLRVEADELARLAATIPTEIQKANRGLLSKDLLQKLKQIEKMSKHLRSTLDH